jgi:signal transduction histidine kinase
MDRLLDFILPAAFALGALTFSTLALFYFRERLRGKPRRNSVLPALTLVCALAFVNNLLFQSGIPQMAAGRLGIALLAMRAIAVGLWPPLIFHLVLESGSASRLWRYGLMVFYAGGIATAVAQVLQETGMLAAAWTENLYRAPAIALSAISAAGLVFLTVAPRAPRAAERAHRRWLAVLLALMLVCAGASLLNSGAYLDQLPDYLLLAFFGVSLYYRERLVFFDVLLKRGVFLALGLTAVTAARAANTAWTYAFALLLWLAGPWIYMQVTQAVNRVWLRRPYSPPDAERHFATGIQAAGTEEDLRTRAAELLTSIFQAAGVTFGAASGDAETDGLTVALGQEGFIRLAARPNGLPYLSDDRRLLQSLAGALAMALQNVRYGAERRRHQELEQQLRLLATRAELKALRAQINPHFLFNALSVIAGLMHYEPELAAETVDRLAQVFRYTLRKSENEWARLGEEIEFITAYLAIEQARFGSRLQVEFQIDPAASLVLIPAMSIQPLVENAVKHGVSKAPAGGAVAIRATLAQDCISIEVSDTGPGFPPLFELDAAGESHGLRNIAERLRGYYGDSARLSWESGGGRTRVMLQLPQSAVASVAAGERR